jgi:hypothetical protein
MGVIIINSRQTTLAQSFFPPTQSSPSSSQTNSATNGSLLTYENPTYGFRMQYPSGWIVRPHSHMTVEFVLQSDKLDPYGRQDASISV